MPAPTRRVAVQGARGEGVIPLPEGDEVTVLYTNRALVEAETALGKPILVAVQAMAEGAIAVGDVVQLLLVGMRAARRDARTSGAVPTVADAYDIMDQVGLTSVTAIVIEAVAAVLSYGQNTDAADQDPNA